MAKILSLSIEENIRKRKLNPTHSIPQSQIRLAEIIW